jgi:hypothetical protein
MKKNSEKVTINSYGMILRAMLNVHGARVVNAQGVDLSNDELTGVVAMCQGLNKNLSTLAIEDAVRQCSN